MQPTKIQNIFDVLDQGDPKSAMKTFLKEIEKNGKKIMTTPENKAQTKIIKAAICSASGNFKEASLEMEEAMKELANINMAPGRVEEILDHFVKLRHMLVNVGQSEGYFTLANNPYII